MRHHLSSAFLVRQLVDLGQFGEAVSAISRFLAPRADKPSKGWLVQFEMPLCLVILALILSPILKRLVKETTFQIVNRNFQKAHPADHLVPFELGVDEKVLYCLALDPRFLLDLTDLQLLRLLEPFNDPEQEAGLSLF
jgi:hypothetical protein